MTRLTHLTGLSIAPWLCLACLGAETPASVPALTGFPFTNETLRYTVNWASGVSLGEAHMSATRAKPASGAERWDFDMALDASVPGFAVSDHYRAGASQDLCSINFDKQIVHGARKSHEEIEFDSHDGVARRHTSGGGESDVPISQCARDALTFLYHARREMGQGRVAPFEDILFGSPYQVRLDYTGPQTVKVGNKSSETDRVVATLKGPASEITFEIFFARDAARTPLMIRVPLSLGTFSLELAR